ncbi:hypothetical protein BOW53_11135 [Solemya pervernicosa gill symbiont]|uniref:SH3b domain-containing protein n=1 Tax=Solemya pervernicosa gill symbiont TaxID=642797 RepID=A0A1T2L3L0_9GAMM|nr:SH3 domain-containing protein [Solemya pervernicosa gill symbiont]OOZ39536.1 hypothetical protein BOW53_11135 [Solemya pervernicosa gill symbiont]
MGNQPQGVLNSSLKLLITLLLFSSAACAEEFAEVQIAEPYIELHTGPGRGYPVFHVAARGEWLTVLKRRTDWYQVRTQRSHEIQQQTGWVKHAAMALTLNHNGEVVDIAEPGIGDFSSRRWEMGMLGGDFSGANLIAVYAAYSFNANLAAEVGLSQILGSYSDSQHATLNLAAQPFTEWRYTPFFTLGTGVINTNPRTTLVQSEDRVDPTAFAGIGLRAYLTRRFLLRAEYRHHTLFSSRDENEEIDEWKAGIAFFF